MKKLLSRLLVASLLLSAGSAQALRQTIKRENPLILQTAYLKGMPIGLGVHAVRGVAFDGTQVWVALAWAPDVLQRYDIASNKKVGSDIAMPAGSFPNVLVFDGAYMWAFCLSSDQAFKYSTNGVLQSGFPITLSGSVRGAAFDGEYIWASTNAPGYAVDRINVSTREVTTTPNVGTRGAVAFDGNDLWISEASTGTAKVSGTTGELLFFDPLLLGPSSVNGIAFDGRAVWITSQTENVVRKIDPATNAVLLTLATNPDPRNVAFDGTHVWVSSAGSEIVQKIDIRTNSIVDTFQMPAGVRPYSIVFDGIYMWIGCDTVGGTETWLFKFLATHN